MCVLYTKYSYIQKTVPYEHFELLKLEAVFLLPHQRCPSRSTMSAAALQCHTAAAGPEDGSIALIFGPMFSGKSSELQRRLRRFAVAKKRVLMVKYQGDTRYDDGSTTTTHDRLQHPAMAVARLADVPLAATDDADVIGIDEASFLPDIVEFCEAQANRGKTVIVASLDGTFQRQAFGRVCELVPLAEEVVKLTAVCTGCGKPAAFSRRLDQTSTEVEDIGGAEKYDAVCRSCFFASERAERDRYDPTALARVASSPTDGAKAVQAMKTLAKLSLGPPSSAKPGEATVVLLKAVITAFPCVSLPFLAVPLRSQPTVAISDRGGGGGWRRGRLQRLGRRAGQPARRCTGHARAAVPLTGAGWCWRRSGAGGNAEAAAAEQEVGRERESERKRKSEGERERESERAAPWARRGYSL
eukprot:SAG22_NODE_327_length_12278_cov_10.550209_4_plen_414_part_00